MKKQVYIKRYKDENFYFVKEFRENYFEIEIPYLKIKEVIVPIEEISEIKIIGG